ncbi:FecCD family ABC transporter permease [Brucellaceae bacterium C25G]
MAAHQHQLCPLVVCSLIALLTFILAIFLGVSEIPPPDIWHALSGHGTPQANSVIIDIRLPRIICGALSGINLAMAGLILQNIMRNPLADPSIMGISQGATFAISVFLLVTLSHNYHGSSAIPVVELEYLPAIGIVGGLFSGFIIYCLGKKASISPLRLTLCGIAVGAFLHAVAIGLIAGWGSNRLEIILDWLTGSLYARSWEHVYYLLPYTFLGTISFLLMHRPFELLKLDANSAASFGLSYHRYFKLALLIACLLAASAVGTVGPISFIGLIVPHMARFFSRKNPQLIIPLTILLGVITVTTGDLTGRLLGQAQEIPLGVITALMGAPLFIILMRKTP